MRRFLSHALLTSLLAASPIVAQEPLPAEPAAREAGAADPSAPAAWPDALRDGRWALDFALSTATPGLGVRRMISGRTALGLDLNASYRRSTREFETPDTLIERTSRSVSLMVSPTLRRYLAASGDVAGFASFRVTGGVAWSRREDNEQPDDSSWFPLVGTGAGIGLEWFVTDALSVSGQFGVDLVYAFAEDETDVPSVGTIRQRDRRLDVQIRSSGAMFSLHF